MVARPGQCAGALAAKRVRITWRIITWAAVRVCFALAVARRRARCAEIGLDLARCATCMFCFWGFVFWRSRARVCGGARWWGETDLATRGARCTQGVSCAHVCVCVCVPAPQCRVPVCTTRLAFAGSNSAGRAHAAWLACVCVPLFLVLC